MPWNIFWRRFLSIFLRRMYLDSLAETEETLFLHSRSNPHENSEHFFPCRGRGDGGARRRILPEQGRCRERPTEQQQQLSGRSHRSKVPQRQQRRHLEREGGQRRRGRVPRCLKVFLFASIWKYLTVQTFRRKLLLVSDWCWDRFRQYLSVSWSQCGKKFLFIKLERPKKEKKYETKKIFDIDESYTFFTLCESAWRNSTIIFP